MSEQRIGKYVIEGELGRGAMGVVYKAVDPVIGRTVAVKTIRFDVLTDAGQRSDAQKRFLREAQSAGALSHPNIVTIYEIGEADGTTFIAMEYVEGRSLDALLASGARWDVSQVVVFAVQLAEALEAAHRKGVVHRDIKPGNILVDAEGRPHVVDFGIARLSSSTMTQTSMVMGTPFYMSPEQIAGRKIDHRADIFALGAVLYEMLTLEKPFPGDTLTTVIYKIMNEEPLPIRELRGEVPDEIAAIVTRALAKDLGGRYASCREMIADLSPFLAAGPSAAGTTVGPLSLSPGLPALGKKSRPAKAPTGKRPAVARTVVDPEAAAEGERESPLAEAAAVRRKPLLLVVGLMMTVVAVVVAILLLSSREPEPIVARTGGGVKVEISEKGVLGSGEKEPVKPGPGGSTGTSPVQPPTSAPGSNVPAAQPASPGGPPPAAVPTETVPPAADKPVPGDPSASAKTEPAQPAPVAKGPTRLPQLVRQVDPVYPADALAARVEGDVKLEITVGFNGRVEKARVVKSIPKLDLAALDAVGKWEFQPGLFEGVPIKATLETTIHFALPPEAAARPVPKPAETAPPAVKPAPKPVEIPPPAAPAPRTPSPAQKLARAQDALNRGAFRDALAAAEELLAADPRMEAAKAVAMDAIVRLAPSEIKDLVDQYALAYRAGQPSEFFRTRALPDVYLRLRSDLDMTMRAYRDIQIAISKLTLDFQAARYPVFTTRATFAQVMTGISAARGNRGLMFDGRYSWILERREGDWVITAVRVE